MPTKTSSKPIVRGPIDGNIFAIVGACSRALKQAGQDGNAKKLEEQVMASDSYDSALAICKEYVKFRL
jgi:hypothetical protein